MSMTAAFDDTPRLCYVRDSFAWFGTREQVELGGDDWNDAPHDCNAGEPYAAGMLKVAWDAPWLEVVTHRPGYVYEYLSVDELNVGEAPWLMDHYSLSLAKPVYAGVTLPQFARLIRASGGEVYVPASNMIGGCRV